MRPRLLPFGPLVSVAAFAMPLVFVLSTGCDQLNKPLSTSSSSSSSSGGSSKTSEADAGDLAEEGGTAAPAPSITAQPGDIRL